jgi:hypothetical protein
MRENAAEFTIVFGSLPAVALTRRESVGAVTDRRLKVRVLLRLPIPSKTRLNQLSFGVPLSARLSGSKTDAGCACTSLSFAFSKRSNCSGVRRARRTA